MNIENKNVVITGASSGIGLAILNELLKNNCHVVACARHIENVKIENEYLSLFKCDVSNEKELDELFNYALNKLGDIDLFISNAGFAYYEKIEGIDYKHIEDIFKTNVYSCFYCAEKLKELKCDKPYNFVVTASAMAELSLPGYALYSSTKAAVKGFADAYRYELNDGQYFEVVYPIATKTKFFNRAGDHTPVPWPTQTPETVAKKVIKGIKRNKKHIYPSMVFHITSILNRVFPFVLKIYVDINNKSFKKWQGEKNDK